MREILIAAVDEGQNARPPAVGNLQQHGAVALVRVLRADGNEVGGEFNFTVLQADGIREVNNALVVWVGDGQ